MGIALSLGLGRMCEVVRRIALFLCRKMMGPEETPATDLVMRDLSVRHVVPALLAEVLSEERSPNGVLSRIVRDYVLASPIRLLTTTRTPQSRLHRCCHRLFTMTNKRVLLKFSITAVGALFPIIFLSLQFSASKTNLIVGGDTVRSNDPMIGAWFPDVLAAEHMVNTSIFPAVNEFQTDLIFKAVAYADACYKEDARNGECSLFYKPRLDYTERRNVRCPFQEHMCLGGPDNAFELDTDWTDA